MFLALKQSLCKMNITSIARHCIPQVPVPSDIAISQSVTPLPIAKVAAACGVTEDELLPFGKYKGKIELSILDRLKNRPMGKHIVVTGCTPTPLGEGKSTTTIGLAQSLGAHLGKNVIAAVRQPSLGPVFGVKGSAAGGGYSQIIPMEDFTLGLPDINAVAAANNLLAAAIDTRMFHEATQSDDALFKRLVHDHEHTFCEVMKKRLRKLGITKEDPAQFTPEEIRRFARLDIDPATITIQRVVDVNDRYLRRVTIGQGAQEKGLSRQSGFDIAVASEVMAILALATSLQDLRDRLGRMVIGMDKAGEPVTAEDVGCAGAMAVLLKEALLPNIMQTLEGTPVLVHTGPFASIATGNSSVLADQIALRLVGEDGYCITEAGFGADMGMQKAFDIKARVSGIVPAAVVLVATVRALKHHGGVPVEETKKPNAAAVREGCANLRRHVENVVNFGVPVVVCINKFTSDTEEEIAIIVEESKRAGAFDAVESNHWAMGGKGAVALAHALVRAAEQPVSFKYTFDLGVSLKDKIFAVATKIYRADGVDYTEQAEKQLATFERAGFGKLPVCLAKTALSFTANPEIKNAPTGFRILVKDARASVGAGFIYPLLGEIQTLPGLPTRPAYYDVDIDAEGKIVGMF
jgi:formyltetrahydrofolate synthetase